MNISKMLPSDTFKDKTVLVTGGGTCLGKSIGKHILELGGALGAHAGPGALAVGIQELD